MKPTTHTQQATALLRKLKMNLPISEIKTVDDIKSLLDLLQETVDQLITIVSEVDPDTRDYNISYGANWNQEPRPIERIATALEQLVLGKSEVARKRDTDASFSDLSPLAKEFYDKGGDDQTSTL